MISIMYFNSTMVRLKESEWTSIYKALFDFNSTMVRLKVNRKCMTVRFLVYFNSTMVRLKGFEPGAWKEVKGYFNSTMVRLKASADQLHVVISSFQFHYGTIKSSISLPPIPYCCCNFNSTMVRLKDYNGEVASADNTISIPLWYD